MLYYIFRRILMMIPTLMITSALIFTIIELPPGDYLESYIAELQAQGESVDTARIEFLRKEYGFDKPPVERYFSWVGGMFVGDFGYSFDYELPVTASRRRPAVPDHHRLVRDHHLHLADRVSDRHLFGHAPVQLGRLRAYLPRPPRPRHAEFPAGAGADVPRQCLVRHVDRRPDGPRLHRPADELGEVRLGARASLDPGARHRHGRHGGHDPPHPRQPARRAAEAVCDDRARQGPAARRALLQISAAHVAELLHLRHRLPAAGRHLRRRNRGDRAVAARRPGRCSSPRCRARTCISPARS